MTDDTSQPTRVKLLGHCYTLQNKNYFNPTAMQNHPGEALALGIIVHSTIALGGVFLAHKTGFKSIHNMIPIFSMFACLGAYLFKETDLEQDHLNGFHILSDSANFVFDVITVRVFSLENTECADL